MRKHVHFFIARIGLLLTVARSLSLTKRTALEQC
jgi:hypothetical protein